MFSEPFISRDNAAPNIQELLKYLAAVDDGNFLYRGQTRRYEGPLLPSAFRSILQEKPIIMGGDDDFRYSLRKLGQRFIGNFIWDREDYHNYYFNKLFHKGNKANNNIQISDRDADAYFKAHFDIQETIAFSKNEPLTLLDNFLESTTSTVEFNSLVKRHGAKKAVSIMLQEAFTGIAQQLPFFCNYVDNYHRHRFYTDILINSVGFLLGSLISQHYGFSSGFLDATTDIKVAAFFATHAAPDYNFIGTSGPDNLGVIYRMPNVASPLSSDQIFNLAYESAPGTLITWDILSRLEKDVSLAESLETVRICFELRTKPCETIAGMPLNLSRRYDLINIPKGTVSSSRIGRQKAAVIIPDEIQKAVRASYRTHPFIIQTVLDSSKVLCQQSVEDLNYRPGLKCFYFHHSTENPCPEITPAYLWPNEEDSFLDLITFLFFAGLSYFLSPGYILPNRIDLIDPGFDNIKHDELVERNEELLRQKKEDLNATADFLETDLDKQLYYVYKAATLSYQGHVTGDGSAIETGIKYCQLARNFDKTSVTLVALEMLLNEAMGRMSELFQLRARALELMSDGGLSADSLQGLGYPSAFHFFMSEIYYPLYLKRFKSDFAWFFYEMYQTS